MIIYTFIYMLIYRHIYKLNGLHPLRPPHTQKSCCACRVEDFGCEINLAYCLKKTSSFV